MLMLSEASMVAIILGAMTLIGTVSAGPRPGELRACSCCVPRCRAPRVGCHRSTVQRVLEAVDACGGCEPGHLF